jgi:hypothetical protein
MSGKDIDAEAERGRDERVCGRRRRGDEGAVCAEVDSDSGVRSGSV